MKDLYGEYFITAMVKEVRYQLEYGKYSIIPKSQVQTGGTILP